MNAKNVFVVLVVMVVTVGSVFMTGCIKTASEASADNTPSEQLTASNSCSATDLPDIDTGEYKVVQTRCYSSGNFDSPLSCQLKVKVQGPTKELALIVQRLPNPNNDDPLTVILSREDMIANCHTSMLPILSYEVLAKDMKVVLTVKIVDSGKISYRKTIPLL